MKRKTKITAFLVVLIALSLSIARCSHNAFVVREMQNSINYLSDTITEYSDRLGRVSVQRELLETNAKHLKEINRALYDELKVEKKTKFITKTKIKYVTDTLYNYGNYTVVSDSILTDVSFDLGNIIVGYDKNNRLFAKSTNPNVVIDSLYGVLLTKRPRRLGVGLFFGTSLNYGLLGRDLDVGLSLGVGITYRLNK